ncbi:replication-associated protein [Crucivirus-427]|nr:replication-associated protein [Crucivirus-427]
MANIAQDKTEYRRNRFMFTWFDYPEQELYQTILQSFEHVAYYIIGEETTQPTLEYPEGRPHLQGYMEFSANVKRSSLWNMFKKGSKKKTEWYDLIKDISWKPVDGTRLDNYNYCRKLRPCDSAPNAEWFEYGVPNKEKQQGRRIDLDIMKEAFKDGRVKTMQDLQNLQGIGVACYKLGEQWVNELEPPCKGPKICFVLHGDTGCGKSVAIKNACDIITEAFGDMTKYTMGTNPKWINGYKNHEIVVMDDIRSKHWDYSTLLRMLDWMPIMCEVKGGHAWWNPEIVFISNPLPMDIAFANIESSEGSIAQLTRRINGPPERNLGGSYDFNTTRGKDKFTTDISRLLTYYQEKRAKELDIPVPSSVHRVPGSSSDPESEFNRIIRGDLSQHRDAMEPAAADGGDGGGEGGAPTPHETSPRLRRAHGKRRIIPETPDSAMERLPKRQRSGVANTVLGFELPPRTPPRTAPEESAEGFIPFSSYQEPGNEVIVTRLYRGEDDPFTGEWEDLHNPN